MISWILPAPRRVRWAQARLLALALREALPLSSSATAAQADLRQQMLGRELAKAIPNCRA